MVAMLMALMVIGALSVGVERAIGAGGGQLDRTSTARSVMPASPVYTYTTVITVTSGIDPDTSDSNTCVSHSPCTLRRAVIQARSAVKPVLIRFNIPATVGRGL